MVKTDIKEYDTAVSTKSELLREVKKVLEQEKCKDESSISLYDLSKLMEKKRDRDFKIREELCSKITNCSRVCFLADSMEVLIVYHNSIGKDEKVYFKKIDGDLIIVNKFIYHPISYTARYLLHEYGNEISGFYDKCIENLNYYRYAMRWNNPKSVNSNFSVIIDNAYKDVTISDSNENFFSLRASSSLSYDYDCNCNSNNIIDIIRGNEDELFKRIFVKISDCPEWTHEDLYGIRKEQLEEQQRIDYEEMKKQKRLELFRKLNIFNKNLHIVDKNN